MSSKTILVTGACGHLGRAVIKALHTHDHTLIATTFHSPLPSDCEKMVSQQVKMDLADESLTNDALEQLTKAYPDLNAAVLLAGGFEMGDFENADSSQMDDLIRLNFKTAYHVVRPLVRYFENNNGGQFILIAARPAIEPNAGKHAIAYSISKAMVVQLSKLINAEGKRHHIHSTVIIPSTLDTLPNRESMPGADHSKWVKTSDLAEVIAFILSEPGGELRDTELKVYGDA